MWIGGFIIVGDGAATRLSHSNPRITNPAKPCGKRARSRSQRLRECLISPPQLGVYFLGLPTASGLYIHNDTCVLWASPRTCFSDLRIQAATCFRLSEFRDCMPPLAGTTAPNALSGVSGCSRSRCCWWVARWPPVRFPPGNGRLQWSHHIHAFTTTSPCLILLKGVLYKPQLQLIPIKANLASLPCDGRRGGTCQVFSLGTTCSWVCSRCTTPISIVIFHFS